MELAAHVRYPIEHSGVLFEMRERVKEQLQVMCGGYYTLSVGGAAIRQALKMTMALRRIQIADLAPFFDAAPERPTEAPFKRQKPFKVIDGGRQPEPRQAFGR